ncbi:hypothetical protein D9M69_648520 [compost metagenome]
MQWWGPVPGELLEQLPAPGERHTPGVLPCNGQNIEGHERSGQLIGHGGKRGSWGDHALLQRIEIQPVPVPNDGFTIQDHPGRQLLCESDSCVRQDSG